MNLSKILVFLCGLFVATAAMGAGTAPLIQNWQLDPTVARHALNNSALKIWPVAISPVVRDGYAWPGDSGAPITYYYNSTPCSVGTGGAGDDGWQVKSSVASGCWVASLPSSGADIRVWGAQASTISDSTPFDSSAAVRAAIVAASAGQAGGKVIIPASYFLVAQNADLDLRSFAHVTIACAAGSGIGVQPTGGSNLKAPCTLQLNPAYTFLSGPNWEIGGIRISNMNVEIATDVRSGINAVKAFAGDGLVITQNDTWVHNVQINGFNQAIRTISPYNYRGAHIGPNQMYHVRLDDNQGDDTNFITMGDCGDSCPTIHADAWNFITVNAGAATYTITNLTAYSDNTFEVGVSTEGVPLVSGDTIELYGILGVGQPLGRYTVGTIVDSTHFTLLGTTFASGYTPPPTNITGTTVSGSKFVTVSSTTGLVNKQYISAQGIGFGNTITNIDVPNSKITLATPATGTNSGIPLTIGNGAISMPTGIRKGIAYEYTGTNIGGQYAASLWDYGHDVSLHIGPLHGPVNVDHLWVDGPPFLSDGTQIGVWHEGFGSHIFGAVLLNKAVAVKNTSTDSWQRPITFSGAEIHGAGCQSGNAPDGSAIDIESGAVAIDSSFFSPACSGITNPGYNEIHVGNNATLKISTTNLNAATIGYTTPSQCLNVTIDGVSPNCTPPLTTTPCLAGQLSWDNNNLYICAPANNWGAVLTSDVTSNQTTISPPVALPAGKSALLVKSNDGSSTGWGGQITLNDNAVGAVNATKIIRVSATDGTLSFLNSTSSQIFSLSNEGAINSITDITAPFGISITATGTSTPAWVLGTSYTNSSYVTSNGNIYHVIGGACTAGGTSGPNAPSGFGVVTDGTGGTGPTAACKWEFVSPTYTGNVELHAKSTASVVVCSGSTTNEKGLYVKNGQVIPGLCDASGGASGGVVDLGTVADPFGDIRATSETIDGGITGSPSLSILGHTTVGAVGPIILLQDTNAGVTFPKKYIRLTDAGNIQIIDSAYSAALLDIDNSGNTTIGGSLSTGVYTIAAGPNTLPACTSITRGQLLTVSDFSGTRSYLGAMGTGGGVTYILAFCGGTGASPAWEQH